MRIYRSKDVLNFWEETYGELKTVWKPLFLNHRAMRKILKFDSDQIKVAIRRNKKLDMVLQDLEAQNINKEEFDRKQNPFYDANKGKESSPTLSEYNPNKFLPRYKKGRVSKNNLRKDAKVSPKILICPSCGVPIRRDGLSCKCS